MNSSLSDRETANWSKGSTALTVTKIGLSKSITNTLKNYLKSWKKEQACLPEFFINIEKGNIKYRRKKGWTIECECQSCKEILNRLLKIHVNPKSIKIVWNPFEKPKNKHVLFKLTQNKAISRGSYDDAVCSVCRLPDCPFERHRKGITLFEDHENDIVDKYYWKIANLFMFRGKERNSIANTGPEDTDSALIFKMMKNCTLFNLNKGDDETEEKDSDDNNEDNTDEEDENDEDVAENEIYEELLEVRNFLMHTPDNRLSDKNLEECFKQMKTFLRADKLQDDWSKKAVEELSKKSSEEAPKPDTQETLRQKGLDKARRSTKGLATASGAATGATIGFIAGPPGAILGAAVGGLIGKLMDDKT